MSIDEKLLALGITLPSVATPAAAYVMYAQSGNQVFLSGQIGLDPVSMQMVEGVEAQAVRVFDNLKAVAEAAGASFADVVKINIYMTDLSNFGVVNEVMMRYFSEPYPARATVGVRELPRAALVEADLTIVLG